MADFNHYCSSAGGFNSRIDSRFPPLELARFSGLERLLLMEVVINASPYGSFVYKKTGEELCKS